VTTSRPARKQHGNERHTKNLQGLSTRHATTEAAAINEDLLAFLKG
jgi:hypothetical protein